MSEHHHGPVFAPGPKEWVDDDTVVAILRLPMPVGGMMKLVKGLEAVYGKGLTIGGSVDRHLPIHLPEGKTHE